MSDATEYGEKFEGAIITVMSIVIGLSVLGAALLMSYGIKECRTADYTYCEAKHAEH